MNRFGGILVLAALLPAGANAAAGKVLFAVGKVEITRAGQPIAATRGTAVEIGDTVSTGPTGMTQLRFNDGALLSLRAGSTMQVEDYQLPKTMPVAAQPAMLVSSLPPGAAKPDTGGGGRSVLRLVRGAFRTITGLIGKGQGDDYRVLTPAATIGIRGTDYTAAYCEADCGDSEDGLYVGVSHGEVTVENDAGQKDLGQNEYSYTKDAGTPPEQTTAPPEALETPIEVPDEKSDEDTSTEAPAAEQTPAADSAGSANSGAGDGSSDSSGSENGSSSTADSDAKWGTSPAYAAAEPTAEASATYTPAGASPTADAGSGTGGTSTATPPVTEFQLQPGVPASYAYALNGSSLKGSGANGVYLDDPADAGAMTGFFNNSAFTEIGTAQNLNRGGDSRTGIQWGRWSGGTIQSGGSAIALGSNSLHWIYALAPDVPVIPVTGTASYALIGNTDPTSGSTVGFLGSAVLSADFLAQTVHSELSVGFGSAPSGSLYTAIGDGTIGSGALFSGTYDPAQAGANVGGNFNGFFTNGASAAGLSFTLSNGVTGAAAFEKQ